MGFALGTAVMFALALCHVIDPSQSNIYRVYGISIAVALLYSIRLSIDEHAKRRRPQNATEDPLKQASYNGPFRCPHNVALGLRGKRCSACVANMEGLHDNHRQLLRKLEIDIELLEKAHHNERARAQEAYQARMRTLAGLQSMDPYVFEKHVARVYESLGYTTQVTKGSGDGGVDIVATRNGTRTVIQCKRYATDNKVGAPEIQMLYGAMAHDGASSAKFVTTSSFTDQARAAASKLSIELIDGNQLLNLIRQAGL
jgi:restriction system protein